MIKNFETYINEDYFSKLANRKDNGNVRMENEITEDFVRSIIENDCERYVKSITIRKDGNETVVDINGHFNCSLHIDAIPFQFGKVTGDFSCAFCKLTSLKGCPKEVGGNFYCCNCGNLVSLQGCPEKVGKDFSCAICENLTSLEGCPKKVGGDFYCMGCGRQFTKEEIKLLCNTKGDTHVND